MPFIIQFLLYCALIAFLLYSLRYIVKFCWCLHDYIYDKKNNIKKATIIPIKTAKITNMKVNNIAIEIPSIEPIVIM